MESHLKAHQDLEWWRSLAIGQEITVVKRSPEGNEAARYPGVIVAREPEDDWLAIRALWTYKRVELDGLAFEPGDDLLEWFSPTQPFNAFAVLSPAGTLRGWYANVTYPAYLEPSPDGEPAPTLVWHDLYLDLVGLPDGSYVIRDEDELAESGLSTRDPLLHGDIVAAMRALVLRFMGRKLPFRLMATGARPDDDHRQSQNESV